MDQSKIGNSSQYDARQHHTDANYNRSKIKHIGKVITLSVSIISEKLSLISHAHCRAIVGRINSARKLNLKAVLI